MPFRMVTSLHGRRLGLSSTGGIIQAINSTGRGSTTFDMAAQMWGNSMLATHSSSLATLRNNGVNLISSATAASYAFTVAAPAIGVYTEILSASSATTITLDTSATTITFATTGNAVTTGLTIALASTLGGCVGQALVLRGLSATR